MQIRWTHHFPVLLDVLKHDGQQANQGEHHLLLGKAASQSRPVEHLDQLAAVGDKVFGASEGKQEERGEAFLLCRSPDKKIRLKVGELVTVDQF